MYGRSRVNVKVESRNYRAIFTYARVKFTFVNKVEENMYERLRMNVIVEPG